MRALRSTVATLLGALVLAGCSGSPDSAPRSSPTDGGTSAPELSALWSAPLSTWPDSGEDVTNPVVAGSRLLVLAHGRMTAYDRETGKVAWTTPLGPGVTCGNSPAPGPTGVVAVLLKDPSATTCNDIAAIDATTGRRLWTAPIPRAARSLRHATAAVGASTVVVTGFCGGFARFELSSGKVASVLSGDCASDSVSDGPTIAVSEQSRGAGDPTTYVSLYDAATGRRTSRAPLQDGARLGEVVSSDPLVVTARTKANCALIDLSGRRPELFGLRAVTSGSYGAERGCQVPGVARVGDVVWLEGGEGISGYNLVNHHDAGHGPANSDQILLGAHDNHLIMADSTSARAVLRTAPATGSGAPLELGTLPGPAPLQCPSTTPLSRGCTALVADTVVVMNDTAVTAYRVPPE